VTRLDALFHRIASEQDALQAASSLDERLVSRIRQGARPKRAGFHRSWVLAPALAALVALGVTLILNARSPLGVEVGPTRDAPRLGAWLEADGSNSLPLEFSDGSRFELAPRSKARVVDLRREGARVELASGSVKVSVVPRSGADFRLDAGPFGVRVTGTRFELEYSPKGDVFELFLEEGQVELTGCVFGQGRKLAAGQRVRASCAQRSVDVSYGRKQSASQRGPSPAMARADGFGTAPRGAEPSSAAGSPQGAAQGDRRTPSGAASVKSPDSSWVALARKGSYEEAFSVVHAQGFEAECSRQSAEMLALLADVARHAGAPRQAEHALRTLRRRFAGSNEAALAAFSLGRLEFDEYQAYPSAATWFRTYLNERPRGSMTREALGRLLEAHYRARDLASAREVAARYLREYPSGPHAELASRLASSP
jgi:transmembrane sensor